VAAVLAALALACAAGCGGHAAAPAASGAFGWLRPAAPPAGWSRLTLARIHGDAGTVSAAQRRGGSIVGYLNVTPGQAGERLPGWAAFRIHHNVEEGNTSVRLIDQAEGLHFRSGTGSCVIDVYRTSSGAGYREIACIVAGRTGTYVVIGAAPPSAWVSAGPQIERSISSFVA
jgi:hypothetical protein